MDTLAIIKLRKKIFHLQNLFTTKAGKKINCISYQIKKFKYKKKKFNLVCANVTLITLYRLSRMHKSNSCQFLSFFSFRCFYSFFFFGVLVARKLLVTSTSGHHISFNNNSSFILFIFFFFTVPIKRRSKELFYLNVSMIDRKSATPLVKRKTYLKVKVRDIGEEFKNYPLKKIMKTIKLKRFITQNMKNTC